MLYHCTKSYAVWYDVEAGKMIRSPHFGSLPMLHTDII